MRTNCLNYYCSNGKKVFDRNIEVYLLNNDMLDPLDLYLNMLSRYVIVLY